MRPRWQRLRGRRSTEYVNGGSVEADVERVRLASLIECRGSFLIIGSKHRPTHPRFVVVIRADQIAQIEHLREVLGGVGSIRTGQSSPLGTKHYSSNRALRAEYWVVGRDCVNVISLVGALPLESRKRDQYLIWVEAVSVYEDDVVMKVRESRLRELKVELREMRDTQKAAAGDASAITAA